MCDTLLYQWWLDHFGGDWCQTTFLEFIDVPACHGPREMSLFEQLFAGDVDNQFAILLYQLVRIPDMIYDQQYEAGVSVVYGRLPAKGHHVRIFHSAGCYEDNTARLNQPFCLA